MVDRCLSGGEQSFNFHGFPSHPMSSHFMCTKRRIHQLCMDWGGGGEKGGFIQPFFFSAGEPVGLFSRPLVLLSVGWGPLEWVEFLAG